MYPREAVVDIVSTVYIIFKKLIQDFEDIFLDSFNKKAFLCNLLMQYLTEQELLAPLAECNKHTEVNVTKIILGSISNTLIRNYCGKKMIAWVKIRKENYRLLLNSSLNKNQKVLADNL